MDKRLLRSPPSVPVLTVHGLFDQEDIYGPIASYLAMEQSDTRNDRNYLVMGPWFHGQPGSLVPSREWLAHRTHRVGLGIRPRYFLNEVMLPFFDSYLKEREPAQPIPPVRAFHDRP